MPSFLSDTRSVLLGNVANVVSGLFVQSVLAWMLLPAGRGEYAACLTFAAVLTLMFSVGQEMANVYHLGAKQIDVSQALSQSLVIGAVASVVACLVGLGLVQSSMTFLEKATPSLFLTALWCVPAGVFYMYLSRVFLGMRLIGAFALISAAPRVAALGALWLASRDGLTVREALLIQAASQAGVALLAGVVLVVRHHARLVRVTAKGLRTSLGYGLRFYLGKLASMTNVQMGTIMLTLWPASKVDLGLFAPASLLAARLWIVAESLQTAMLPRASADDEGKAQSIAQCARLCLFGTAGVALLFVVAARPIIAIVFSEAFLPAAEAFQILLLGVAIRVVPKIVSAYFNGMGRPGVNSMIVGASVATNVALTCMWLPRFGLVGVAWAMVAAYSVEAVLAGVLFVRISKLGWTALCIPLKSDRAVLRRILGSFGARIRGRRPTRTD